MGKQPRSSSARGGVPRRTFTCRSTRAYYRRNGAVVIRPAEETALTLEQRLAKFDPAKHGGEFLQPTQFLGVERW